MDSEPRVFEERPRQAIVPDAWRFATAPGLLAVGTLVLGAPWAALGLGALALFVLFFFRNPERQIAADERTVVAPADGRVLAVDVIEDEVGGKSLRIGIFLSIFDVHVNRAPVAGRVVSIERGGSRYLAAFDPRGEQENVRLAMELEMADGVRVRVTQITGLVARRIVCHPQVGEWLERGVRYGLIRFGSRTDVLLPAAAQPKVRRGQRVRGGISVLARLPEVA